MESKPVGSYEPSGIDVLVVGTGLGGLVATLECVRKGHNVRVLERNADINIMGMAQIYEFGNLRSFMNQVTCTSWV
jgi:predicted oxidoreductase